MLANYFFLTSGATRSCRLPKQAELREGSFGVFFTSPCNPAVAVFSPVRDTNVPAVGITAVQAGTPQTLTAIYGRDVVRACRFIVGFSHSFRFKVFVAHFFSFLKKTLRHHLP
jgi:hypothetical protein